MSSLSASEIIDHKLSISASKLILSNTQPETSRPRNIPKKSKRVFNNSSNTYNDKNSTDLFWNIVGRDNFTVSLNNSPVLCYSSSSSEEELFGIRKFGSWSFRTKKDKTVPTMIPKKDNKSISLITTTIRSRYSKSVSASNTINTLLDNLNLTFESPLTSSQEEYPPLLMSNDLLLPLQLLGREEDTEPVLEINTAEQIREMLPRRLRLASSWNLLYSLDQHGTSMSTMYYQVKDKGPLILIIKDMDNQVFGAFLTEPLKPKPSYYGTGECFLWKSVYLDENDPSSLKVKFYLWTGRNEYIILSEQDYLAIGGGDGRYGLWIDSNLERGSSSRCDTFDNEVLSSEPEFDCVGFEVWGFKN